MKIVRMIARLNVGGPARHVVWLTDALQDEEFQSILITGKVPPGEEDMEYFAADHNVKPIFIPEMSRELSLKDIISLWKIYRELKREKPDIIHTHTAKAGTLGRVAGFVYRWLTPQILIGRPRKVEIIHTYHGHIFHSYYGKLKTKFFLFVEKVLARLATDKILVLSEQQRKEINEDFGVGKTSQFEIVPLGIDLGIFKNCEKKRDTLRNEIKAANDEILIGLIGRLTEIKNHSLFLTAAKLYSEDRHSQKPKIRFLIIGDGHLRKPLESEAIELGISNLVIFLGNRNDPDVFYSGLDIVVLTSFNEGTPLSLIEAMASKKAIVSTAVGGVIDLLGNEKKKETTYSLCERGVKVNSEDARGLYNGLIYLAKNEQLRIELGRKGEEYALAQYSKDRLIADIKSIYKEIS